jgi:hypothetical protein
MSEKWVPLAESDEVLPAYSSGFWMNLPSSRDGTDGMGLKERLSKGICFHLKQNISRRMGTVQCYIPEFALCVR